MPRQYDRYKEMSYVMDLRSYDDVVLFGDVYLPGLKRWVNSVEQIRRAADFRRFQQEGFIFSKAFVSPDVDCDWGLLERLETLRSYDRGFLVGFVGLSPDRIGEIERLLVQARPYADWWVLDSNAGPMLVASFRPEDMNVPLSWDELGKLKRKK